MKKEKTKLDVVLYDDSKQKEWDAFVENSNNGTIFHKMKFLDYQLKNKFNYHHLMFYSKNKIISVLPAAICDRHILKSPEGATFGSFVTKDLSLADHDCLVKIFLDYCKKIGIKEIFLTPELEVYQNIRNQNVVYSLLYNGFSYSNPLFSSILDLRCKQKNPLKFFKNRTKGSVKKSFKKNVVVKQSVDFEEFYPILLENKKKYNIKPTHTLEEIIDIKNRFPNDVHLFTAYTPEGLPIASNLFFVCNKKCILLFYSAHLYRYKEYIRCIKDKLNN